MSTDTKGKIKKKLMELGIVPSNLGFTYLTEAIYKFLTDNSDMKFSWIKLYESVAKDNNSTGTRTERAIRHSIELAFDKPNTVLLKTFNSFMPESGVEKVSNSTFIATVATYIEIGE
jgi:two-component system response regulator (stage 0 sporulation protein A)